MPEIGETLRETRMRRRIDMTEVEAATKIRAKYLRALENEEWDLLPGPTFVKTFLRTYAEYLELDPRLLVEEYRQRFERPSTQDLTPFGPGMGGARRRRQRQRRPIGPFVVVLVGDRGAAGRALPARRRLGRPRRGRGPAQHAWRPPRRPRRRDRHAAQEVVLAQEEEGAAAARLAAADRDRPASSSAWSTPPGEGARRHPARGAASARSPSAPSASGRTSATAACG